MRKLLLNLIIFLLILFGYFGINISINKIIINKTKIPFEKVTTLIVGDSQMARAINPSIFESAKNISQNGEPYFVTYWKLKYLLQKIKVDTIIIGFSHYNLSGIMDRRFIDKKWSLEMFTRIYPIKNLYGIKNIEIDYYEYFNTYFRNMCLFPKRNHMKFIGEYANSNASNITNPESYIRDHYYNNDKNIGISEMAISYLDSIIQLAKIQNIYPILVGTPVHESYYTKIPINIIDRYNLEKSRLVLQDYCVIDLTDYFYKDNYYFDLHHLNEYGAKIFTSEILDILVRKNCSMINQYYIE